MVRAVHSRVVLSFNILPPLSDLIVRIAGDASGTFVRGCHVRGGGLRCSRYWRVPCFMRFCPLFTTLLLLLDVDHVDFSPSVLSAMLIFLNQCFMYLLKVVRDVGPSCVPNFRVLIVRPPFFLISPPLRSASGSAMPLTRPTLTSARSTETRYEEAYNQSAEC